MEQETPVIGQKTNPTTEIVTKTVDKDHNPIVKAEITQQMVGNEKKVVVQKMPNLVQDAIDFTVMGSEDCVVDKEAEELYFVSLRIGKIQGLEGCVNCKVSLFSP